VLSTVVAVVTQQQKSARFRELHQSGTFVIPNPWDVGSAKLLESFGFQALATTSSGMAYAMGAVDGGVGLDDVLDHVRRLTEATSVPLSVDLENGHGAEPHHTAVAVLRAADAGAVGGSIEDYDHERGIYGLDLAVERVRAAVNAAHSLSFRFTLTARAENLIRGKPDLVDTIARLQAYEEAGADVLYAPGLRDADEVRTVCHAVSKPVNVLAHSGLTVAAIAEAGARRISVGGGLTWAAVGGLQRAAMEILAEGTFGAFADSPQYSEIKEWLGA
jgi:2-methylisocitrate lyase-like PEP mutase family enzyme